VIIGHYKRAPRQLAAILIVTTNILPVSMKLVAWHISLECQKSYSIMALGFIKIVLFWLRERRLSEE